MSWHAKCTRCLSGLDYESKNCYPKNTLCRGTPISEKRDSDPTKEHVRSLIYLSPSASELRCQIFSQTFLKNTITAFRLTKVFQLLVRYIKILIEFQNRRNLKLSGMFRLIQSQINRFLDDKTYCLEIMFHNDSNLQN